MDVAGMRLNLFDIALSRFQRTTTSESHYGYSNSASTVGAIDLIKRPRGPDAGLGFDRPEGIQRDDFAPRPARPTSALPVI